MSKRIPNLHVFPDTNCQVILVGDACSHLEDLLRPLLSDQGGERDTQDNAQIFPLFESPQALGRQSHRGRAREDAADGTDAAPLLREPEQSPHRENERSTAINKTSAMMLPHTLTVPLHMRSPVRVVEYAPRVGREVGKDDKSVKPSTPAPLTATSTSTPAGTAARSTMKAAAAESTCVATLVEVTPAPTTDSVVHHTHASAHSSAHATAPSEVKFLRPVFFWNPPRTLSTCWHCCDRVWVLSMVLARPPPYGSPAVLTNCWDLPCHTSTR